MAALRILVLVAAVALAAGASTAAAAPSPPALPGERIAAGVSAAGVDVSGLTIDEAAQKLQATHGERFKKGVMVKAAGRLFRMSAARARVRFDSRLSAERALDAGRTLTPAPGPVPAPPAVDVPLAVKLSHHAVRRFAGSVDRSVSRTPRNATLRITLRRVRATHSRKGRDIDHAELAHHIAAAFGDPRLRRVFRPKLITIKPKVNALQLRKSVPAVITIQQSTFTLRLFQGFKLRKRYRVAVGLPDYPTPRGRFSISSKQVNPSWSAPNSPWAGELAGTTVVGGSAANPLRARWMGIVNGVGIHGTSQDASIGTRASHGCIRMHVRNVIDLYRRVPIGTPVLIG